MLDKPVEEIVYEDGKVVGVKSQGEVCLFVCLCVCVCVCVHQLKVFKHLPRLLVAIVSLVTPATSLTRSRRLDRSVTCGL